MYEVWHRGRLPQWPFVDFTLIWCYIYYEGPKHFTGNFTVVLSRSSVEPVVGMNPLVRQNRVGQSKSLCPSTWHFPCVDVRFNLHDFPVTIPHKTPIDSIRTRVPELTASSWDPLDLSLLSQDTLCFTWFRIRLFTSWRMILTLFTVPNWSVPNIVLDSTTLILCLLTSVVTRNLRLYISRSNFSWIVTSQELIDLCVRNPT